MLLGSMFTSSVKQAELKCSVHGREGWDLEDQCQLWLVWRPGTGHMKVPLLHVLLVSFWAQSASNSNKERREKRKQTS